MIAAIEGTLEIKGDNWAIIKVGGVSLQVHLPFSTLSRIGEPGERVKLYTHLQVKEDDIALYGFGSTEEVDLFRMLISVDGVGPKTALSILSEMSPEQLSLAVASNDIDALTQISGVGKKMAQRLVLELKERLDKGVSPYLVDSNAEVRAALTNLGYSVAEATRAIAALPSSPELTIEDKIKLALQYLASSQGK